MRVSKYIDIDGNNSTWNSSSSYITLPSTFNPTQGILWAGLFWQGRIGDDTNYVMRYGEENGATFNLIDTGNGSGYSLPANLSATGATSIKLKVNTGNYSDVVQNTFYEYSSSGGITYAAYSDVTSIIKAGITTSGNHTFTVANLTTNEGREPSPGLFGGWSLVVIYAEDGLGKMRNISIFSGFDIVDEPSDEFTITDFILPRSGTVNSTLSLFAGEGETRYATDWVKMSDDNVNYDYMPGAVDNNNIFDGVFTGVTRENITGHSNNLQINNNGVDIDSFDVSTLMTTYRDANPNLNTMYIQWYSNNDYITPSMIAFATELYVPKFCYDYAYKQQGKYFTEKNDGTNDPRLVGNVIANDSNESVEMTVFIRNLVDSDIEVTDMFVDILDMNTTQVKYKRETTSLAMIPNIIPVPIADASLSVDDSYIKNIDIGTISSNDYFYIYYQVDPQMSDLNMSINVKANYDLTLAGTTIPYTLRLGSDIDMCSSTNFSYAPVKGMFNIVHNNYYPHSDGNNYYNLPTQVTSREGNFKAIVMDPDNLDTLKGLPNLTRVAVELIDISAFHDTFTSCKELESAITPRIWVEFDANVTSTQFNQNVLIAAAAEANAKEAAGGETSKLPNSYDFYKVANENTAFRISYNTDGENDFLLNYTETSAGSGLYEINNFPSAVRTIGTCSHDVFYFDKNGNFKKDVGQVATACGNAGSAIPESQLEACLECIYGYNTKLVCSRDNLSIRPESFLIHLDDQNQTNPTNGATPPIKLTTNYSGVVGATASVLNLAADYNYAIEVNATNHLNNISSPGYTKSFNSSNLNDKSEYTWEPRGLSAAQLLARNTACNDDANKSSDMRFVDGVVDINSSINQVGEYRLNILDTTWTTVDNDATFMGHHTGSYFISSATPDCLANDSTTQAVNSATLNGCNIASNHLGSSSNLKYNDYNITVNPYEFTVTTTPTIGLNNITPPLVKPFVYMADINTSEDQNMSVQLTSRITAIGRNSTTGLSNFVTGCYAKPLDINISKSFPINAPLDYRYRFHDYNSTFDLITANDINGSILSGADQDANITTTSGYFQKDMNGLIDTTVFLNFTREVNASVNPEVITFITYNVNDFNNLFNADLNPTKTATGYDDINKSTTERLSIIHYYGRTAAKKTTVICTNANANCDSGSDDDDVFIYYEVFCNGAGCNPALLPLDVGGNPMQRVDSRWFMNLSHELDTFGQINSSIDSLNSTFVSFPNGMQYPDNNYTNTSVHRYPIANGLPYTADMDDNVSRWLVHDENNASSTVNTHRVIFRGATEWSGEHETNTTTKTKKIKRVNRRTMW
ncbi:MAG: hypothetical protein GQ474_00230 [Sulfurimonas sp.]|nr:hypothetical protein [Sulfurimonas sp.]